MVIDISLYTLGMFVLKTASWGTFCAILFAVLYYPGDDAYFKPTWKRHTVYGLIVVVLALVTFGAVQINWLP